MTDLQIYPLSEKPEFAETCASFSYGQWGCHVPDYAFNDSLNNYKKAIETKNTNIPCTWVGFVNDKIIGMISLRDEDHPDKMDLKPWLASFFIHPGFRGNGYAHKFIEEALKKAKEMKFSKLYLYTPDAMDLYSTHGWKKIEDLKDPMGLQDLVTLMVKDV